MRADRDATKATADFHFSNIDERAPRRRRRSSRASLRPMRRIIPAACIRARGDGLNARSPLPPRCDAAARSRTRVTTSWTAPRSSAASTTRRRTNTLKKNAAVPRGVHLRRRRERARDRRRRPSLAPAQGRRRVRKGRRARRCASAAKSAPSAISSKPRHLLRTARGERRRLRQDAPSRHAQPPHHRLLLLSRAAGACRHCRPTRKANTSSAPTTARPRSGSARWTICGASASRVAKAARGRTLRSRPASRAIRI